jgi:hypothetical protein
MKLQISKNTVKKEKKKRGWKARPCLHQSVFIITDDRGAVAARRQEQLCTVNCRRKCAWPVAEATTRAYSDDASSFGSSIQQKPQTDLEIKPDKI